MRQTLNKLSLLPFDNINRPNIGPSPQPGVFRGLIGWAKLREQLDWGQYSRLQAPMEARKLVWWVKIASLVADFYENRVRRYAISSQEYEKQLH